MLQEVRAVRKAAARGNFEHLPKVSSYALVKFGADPEAFFENEKGLIVGSELVIPKILKGDTASVVRDGVQLEIHLSPSHCREQFAANLEESFYLLANHLEEKNKERVKLSFKAVVRVTEGQINRLSPKSRLLGCAPSVNIYDDTAKVGVNPETYRVRSAGGHVHLGLSSRHLKDEFRRIIRMCDILLGNQCVLLDREPLMKLRRRVYGRAGECRVQPYGVEYRTLSNFWLRSEPLMSFVLAMARNAVQVIATTDGVSGAGKPWNAEKAMFDYIKLPDIVKAINNNDFDLAMKNYEGIEQFILKHFDEDHDGLNAMNTTKFKKFAIAVNDKGIEKFFKHDAYNYWNENRTYDGWESYIAKVKV